MTDLEASRAIFVKLCLYIGFDKDYITPILSISSEENLMNLILWFQDVMDKTGSTPKMYEMSNRIAEEIFGNAKESV